jgi:hypothetical protein
MMIKSVDMSTIVLRIYMPHLEVALGVQSAKLQVESMVELEVLVRELRMTPRMCLQVT